MNENDSSDSAEPAAEPSQRRVFLGSTVAMAGGLVAGYGAFAAIAGRYLYSSDAPVGWMFVARADQVPLGASIVFVTPVGNRVVIARQAETGGVSDFIALSSVCPHLGCQVHWEPHNDRFFCPCHSGTFDAKGDATGGPPASASPKQPLPKYALRLDEGLLFIEVPLEGVATQRGHQTAAVDRPGANSPALAAGDQPAAGDPLGREA